LAVYKERIDRTAQHYPVVKKAYLGNIRGMEESAQRLPHASAKDAPRELL
jgi:hypothetical protein